MKKFYFDKIVDDASVPLVPKTNVELVPTICTITSAEYIRYAEVYLPNNADPRKEHLSLRMLIQIRPGGWSGHQIFGKDNGDDFIREMGVEKPEELVGKRVINWDNPTTTSMYCPISAVKDYSIEIPAKKEESNTDKPIECRLIN